MDLSQESESPAFKKLIDDIHRCWQYITSDADPDEACSKSEKLEMCLDANRLTICVDAKDSDNYLHKLCEQYGYKQVDAFLETKFDY